MSEFLGNFHFMRPAWLLAALAVIPLAVAGWRRLRSGQAWHSVINEALLPHLLTGSGSQPARWPMVVLTGAWLLCTVALAGPTWQKLPQPVERKEDALVVVLDLSTSMYAEDIAPSRLVRGRQKLLDLLGRKTEGTMGLVAYAGDAHVVSPLTDDLRTVANLLPALEPGIMPVKGSEPGPAIEQAVALLRDSGLEHGQILLVTDGIRAGDREAIDRALAGTAYRLSVLGVGTTDGAPIPTGDGFLRDAEGNIVIPGLERRPLRALAERYGGHYSDIQLGDGDIERILSTDPWGELNTERLLDRQVDTWQDMGHWLVLLLVPVALGAFRRGWLLCLILLPLSDTALAQDWQSWFLNSDQRGRQMLEAGDAKAAAEAFSDPDWQAAARYRAGEYGEALEHYRQGDSADSWYNRGNALARVGRLEEAIDAYDEALARHANMEDAAYNKALLEQLLQQQLNQQQQGQDSQQQDSDQNSDSSPQQDPSQSEDSSEQQDSRGKQQSPEQQAGSEDDRDGQDDSKTNPQQQAQAEQNASQESQQSMRQPQHGDSEEEAQSPMPRDADDIEREMANEQWLRRIPDDPSGLLRRKFLYESRLRANENPTTPRERQNEESW